MSNKTTAKLSFLTVLIFLVYSVSAFAATTVTKNDANGLTAPAKNIVVAEKEKKEKKKTHKAKSSKAEEKSMKEDKSGHDAKQDGEAAKEDAHKEGEAAKEGEAK